MSLVLRCDGMRAHELSCQVELGVPLNSWVRLSIHQVHLRHIKQPQATPLGQLECGRLQAECAHQPLPSAYSKQDLAKPRMDSSVLYLRAREAVASHDSPSQCNAHEASACQQQG